MLFFDEENEKLYTKNFRGKWKKDIIISKEDKIIWNAIKIKKPVAFCNLYGAACKDYADAEQSILVCPLIGKARIIAAMVLAGRESKEEFYSNEIKLVMAIANHVALTIVKVLEASSRWTAGHTERVTEYAIGIGMAMGLSGKYLGRLMICSLLHDIGKIAVPGDILDKARKTRSR